MSSNNNISKFETNRKGDFQVVNNHIYFKAKENKNGSVLWYCKNRRDNSCTASIKILGSHVESTSGEHNHPPYDENEIIFMSAKQSISKAANESRKQSGKSICTSITSKIFNDYKLDPTDPAVSQAAKIIMGKLLTKLSEHFFWFYI